MTYLDLYAQSPEVYFAALAVMLAITLIAYGIFPILFSKIRKNPITAKKFRITCYAVNLIPLAFFLVISEKPSFFPYFVWTSVFSSVGIKMLKKKNIFVDAISKDNAEQPKINTSSLHDIVDTPIDTSIDEKNDSVCKNQKTDSFGEQWKEKTENKKYCKQCGNPIDSKTKKCTGCGKQYFRLPVITRNVVLAVLAVLAFAIASFSSYQAEQYKVQIESYKNQEAIMNEKIAEMEFTIAEKDVLLEEYKSKSSEYKEEVGKLQQEVSNLTEKVSFYDENVVFVTEFDRSVFHKYDCILFKYFKSGFLAYNTDAAISKGIKPCWYCCD